MHQLSSPIAASAAPSSSFLLVTSSKVTRDKHHRCASVLLVLPHFRSRLAITRTSRTGCLIAPRSCSAMGRNRGRWGHSWTCKTVLASRSRSNRLSGIGTVTASRNATQRNDVPDLNNPIRSRTRPTSRPRKTTQSVRTVRTQRSQCRLIAHGARKRMPARFWSRSRQG